MKKIHSIKNVRATKSHVCSFSGRKIPVGMEYWLIAFHPDTFMDGGIASWDEKKFDNYKVHAELFFDFVKDALFFQTEAVSKDLSEDVSYVENVLSDFWNKYKDMPNASKILNKFKDRLTLPL